MNPTQFQLLGLIVGLSVLALGFALWLSRWVLARQRGKPEMQKISDAIQQGAEAFLARQYRTITLLSILVAALIFFGYGYLRTPNPTDPVGDPRSLALYITVSFLLGALSSGIAGYMGMWV